MAFLIQLHLSALTLLPALGAHSSSFLHPSATSGQPLDLARESNAHEDRMMSVWMEYELGGRFYYVNTLTGEKQWDKPVGFGNMLARSMVTQHVGNFVRQDLIESSKAFETKEYRKMTLDTKDLDITLAFQSDISRLDQLQRIAETWEGPISASLLVLESDIPSVDKAIQGSHALRRYVDINLCIAKERWAYYPINKMRNHANSYVRTDYIFIVDGDEDPVQSMGVFKDALAAAIRTQSADPKKTAFVVTSWQWGDEKRPGNEYPHTQADLKNLFHAGKVVLKAEHFPQAYMPMGVGLDEWMARREAKAVPWHDRYEPYMVVHRNTIGLFDERFVGWGGNKAIHVLKMQLERIKLVLLPEVFTFTNQSILDDNAGDHSLPADPDLPGRAASELGEHFGCDECSYYLCVQSCRDGLDVDDFVRKLELN